jgi:hypothetical protein
LLLTSLYRCWLRCDRSSLYRRWWGLIYNRIVKKVERIKIGLRSYRTLCSRLWLFHHRLVKPRFVEEIEVKVLMLVEHTA